MSRSSGKETHAVIWDSQLLVLLDAIDFQSFLALLAGLQNLETEVHTRPGDQLIPSRDCVKQHWLLSLNISK